MVLSMKEKPQQVVQAASEPDWNLVLMSEFVLFRGEKRIQLTTDAERVLGFLAIQQLPVARSRVAGSLWPDRSHDRASANLRSALWRLNRISTSLVNADRKALSLSPIVSVDLRKAKRAASALIDGVDLTDSMPTPDVFVGDLLPTWDYEWLMVERERHRQMCLHALEKLAQALIDQGDFSRALQTALTAMDLDLLRETPHRLVIAVHLKEGNHSEAVRHYRHFRRLLWSELQVDSSPLLRAQMNDVLVSAAT